MQRVTKGQERRSDESTVTWEEGGAGWSSVQERWVSEYQVVRCQQWMYGVWCRRSVGRWMGAEEPLSSIAKRPGRGLQ